MLAGDEGAAVRVGASHDDNDTPVSMSGEGGIPLVQLQTQSMELSRISIIANLGDDQTR